MTTRTLIALAALIVTVAAGTGAGADTGRPHRSRADDPARRTPDAAAPARRRLRRAAPPRRAAGRRAGACRGARDSRSTSRSI